MRHLIILFLTCGLTVAAFGQQRSAAEAQKLIDSLYVKLISGADFKNLANLYSDDPGTAAKGGKYTKIKVGTIIPEFESVVLNLKLNAISKPFQTPFGFHIAQLLEKQGEVYSVRHILIRFKE